MLHHQTAFPLLQVQVELAVLHYGGMVQSLDKLEGPLEVEDVLLVDAADLDCVKLAAGAIPTALDNGICSFP